MNFASRQSFSNPVLRDLLRSARMLLAGIVLLCTTPLLAEDGQPIKVCIPQHTASDAMFHQVANSLSNHKPDKSTHARAQGVQLPNLERILDTDNVFKGSQAQQTLSGETVNRATQERCDYILVISVPDVKTARSQQPNPSSPDQQLTTNTGDPYMRRQDPDLYVQVKYRLYRLNPPASSDGFVSTHDAAPAQAVVAAALDMLAGQVFTKITK